MKDFHGHADQEWLLNFVYSFKHPPKHIFLVHGEIESEEVLKEKIMETTNIPVTIPEYGDQYELNGEIKVSALEYSNNQKKQIRREIVERLNLLKDEINDMTHIVKQDIFDEATKDEEVLKIGERIKELEKQIVNIIEIKEYTNEQ